MSLIGSVLSQRRSKYLQEPLLNNLLVSLDLIADLEVGEALESNPTLATFLHLRDVFLHVLERRDRAWDMLANH